MKYSVLSLLALAGFVHAAPFTGEGVPATTAAVVHLDLEVAGESKLVSTIRELAEAAAVSKPAAADDDTVGKIKRELGVDDKSVRDMTVAVLAGGAPGAEPQAVFRIRGDFNRAKFESLSKTHKELTPHKSGKHTWYSVADLNKAFNGKGGAEKGGVCMPDDKTAIVVTDDKLFAEALAAAEGKSTYKPDAAAKSLFSGKPMLAGYFPESFVKSMKPAAPAPANGKKPSSVTSVVFTLNEAAGNLNLHADTRFDSAAGAREVQAQASMGLGMVGMMLAQDNPQDTPAQKEDKAFAVSALQALKFAANGESFTADFSYPSDALVKKLTEKRQDILDAVAKQAQAGVTAKPRPAKAAAAK